MSHMERKSSSSRKNIQMYLYLYLRIYATVYLPIHRRHKKKNPNEMSGCTGGWSALNLYICNHRSFTRPHTDVSLYLSGFYLTTDADYRYPLLLLLLLLS